MRTISNLEAAVAIQSVATNLQNLHTAVTLIEWLQERGVISQNVDVAPLAFEFALDGEEMEGETRAAFEAIVATFAAPSPR